MAHASHALLFEGAESAELEPLQGTGLLPAQLLKALIEHSREIRATRPIEPDQLQPSSLDLRLGARGYRVRASFLPGAPAAVADKIDALAMHRFALDDAGAVLEKGCVYIVPLLESLALNKRTSAIANLITDQVGREVHTPQGYAPYETRGQAPSHLQRRHLWFHVH